HQFADACGLLNVKLLAPPAVTPNRLFSGCLPLEEFVWDTWTRLAPLSSSDRAIINCGSMPSAAPIPAKIFLFSRLLSSIVAICKHKRVSQSGCDGSVPVTLQTPSATPAPAP